MNKDDVIRVARECGMEVHERKQHARFGLDALLGEDSTDKLMRFAELVRKEELRKHQESELMAACMDMVWQDLIDAGVIGKSVPPMMIPEAVFSAISSAKKKEREACAQLCEQSERFNNGYFAQKIRERGEK